MSHCCGSSGAATTTTTLKVEGMTCNHCRMSVTKALKELDGVTDVVVELEGKKADVTFDPSKVSLQDLKEAVVDAGYQVVD